MMLDIKKVDKHFGGVYALSKCSFEVKEKSITALIGPNGSGKTTLFNAISHLIPIDSGKIIFDGENIQGLKDFEIARKGISRTYQQVRLFKNLTIFDHIALALEEEDEKFFASVFRKEKRKRIKKYLDLVGLKKSLETIATDLSYGQRKLLDLAVAIARPHKLLLLDEPVAGVNPVLRKKMKEIIKKLHKEGETILLIEHDMGFVMDLAEKVVVLDAGKVIAKGTPKQIQKNPKVLEAYLGK